MSIGLGADGVDESKGRPRRRRRAVRGLAILVALSATAAACGGDDDESSDTGAGEANSDEVAASAEGEPTGTLNLGYFPNVTHAPAVIGVEDGIFDEALGDAEVNYSTYNSGTEVGEAILSGAIDASFIGPNPAINAYAESDGAIRIVSGTTSGGASLVVAEGIESPADLEGERIATPSVGNTQDVAARAWLADEGFETDLSGGGDVEIVPSENADTLAAFIDGAIAGAWVPEPWATRLVNEGGGHVLVDEAELWPDGEFVTTHLIVRTDYLEENPQNVRALLTGLLDAIDLANDDPEAAQAATNDGIESITDNRLEDATISGAWENLTFTPDPIASSLQQSKDDAVEFVELEDVDLGGIYDLDILNDLLVERGDEEVVGLDQ
jgi:NitT/TauT family transport system substrate-binding protein